MCSVTFWPRRRGFVLGMNRDEQRSRVAGLPPAGFILGERMVVHPREPHGGTWISVNDRGVCFGLVNWYAIPARAPLPTVSRGEVVLAVRTCDTGSEAGAQIAALPLPRMNPFRLVGYFEAEQRVVEWRWDGRELTVTHHPWSAGQWLSSGFDEPTAQRLRSAAYQRVVSEPDAGSVEWLRRLHGSHEPECGPFSICMHRDDAATVSYTEVDVGAGGVVMRHCNGPVCAGAPLEEIAVTQAGMPALPAAQLGNSSGATSFAKVRDRA